MSTPGKRLIASALGGFAVLFGLVRANASAAFDLAITLKVQGNRHPTVSRLLGLASWPGFPPQSRVIPPVVIGTMLARGRRVDGAFQLAAWGGALISTVVKAIVKRPRPLPPQVEVVVAPLGGSSFPSGHVLTYVGFYGFLAYLVATQVEDETRRRAGVVALCALLALVGPSRIQQGHHWTTDVVASYLLGLAYLLALVEAYDLVTTPRSRLPWSR